MEKRSRIYSNKILKFLLAILVVLVLTALAFIIGAAIGYAVVGEGSNPMEVLNPGLWQHILNFFT